ncbi:MAG: N-terminal phage integrase SAM-like domain-containing protein [Blautia faecis]
MHELQCKERSEWYVADTVSLDRLDEEPKEITEKGFKTKKEAEEWYAHFMLQQSSDPTMTLADFWEIYKADMEKRLRKTTMKQKEYVMNDKVLPYFGKTPINEITAPMIRKWQGELIEKGL